MELEIVFWSVMGAFSLFGIYMSRRLDMQEWKAAAELCGLEIVKLSRWTLTIKARSGEMEVRIGVSTDKQRPTRIVVAASGPPGIQDVSIRSEPLFREEIQIGDPSFDRQFVIEGPVRLVSALLDKEMRHLLSRVIFHCDLQISSGEVRGDMTDIKIFDALPGLLEIARRFAQPLDVPRRLAENATRDPEPGVRLHNLSLLIHEFPKHPVTAGTLREACSDRNPEIRLRAAKELGDEARGILLELAENLEVDAVSADALSLLDPPLPFERVTAVLKRAVRRRRLRTARFCLEEIGRSGAAAAVDVLAKVLARESGELSPAAAAALGATGNPAAEAPLIKALERDHEDLRVAAANALGRVGSAAAVLPLKEAAERSSGRGLRSAARQAIVEIQARIEGASPGQLSLAGAEAGQLSLAEAEAGQLSLAEDPAGQLSLGGESGE